MKPYAKALIGGALVTVLLWACATTAGANRLAFRNEYNTNSWRAVWREMRLTGGFGTISCPLTLEGSLHSQTVTKTPSSLIGYVTAARNGTCATLSGTVLTERLPWHLQYESFTGTLPSISSVKFKIIGFEFQIREGLGIACLYRSTEAAPLLETLNREGGGIISSATLGGSLGSELCGSASFGGTSTSFGTPPPPPTTITLTLI